MKKFAISLGVAALALAGGIATAAPAAATIANVGGGTWNYGTSYVFPVQKNVWSDYVHNTAYHSSTAIGGSASKKTFANARFWSYASVTSGAAESTATYWAKY